MAMQHQVKASLGCIGHADAPKWKFFMFFSLSFSLKLSLKGNNISLQLKKKLSFFPP
jgi:hypothetical protein